MHVCMNVRMDAWMAGGTDARLHGCTDKQMGGREGGMDGNGAEHQGAVWLVYPKPLKPELCTLNP